MPRHQRGEPGHRPLSSPLPPPRRRPASRSGPWRRRFGWHVVEALPFEEIADSLTALYDEQAGELMFAGFLASADVTVDPRVRPVGWRVGHRHRAVNVL